jgi:hypothetical protein
MATDYNSMWNDYQAGRRKDGIREFTSMDDVRVQDSQGRWSDDEQFENGVSTNESSYRSPWAMEAAKRGIIANDDASIARASQEIARTGRLLYEPGKVRTFDQGVVDSYDINDPNKRNEQAQASQMGHDLPDSTALSQAGWQNVTQHMREDFRDQGFIPQAPASERFAQTGNKMMPGLGAGAAIGGMMGGFDGQRGHGDVGIGNFERGQFHPTSGPSGGPLTQKRDDLYNTLLQRSQQALGVNLSDPNLKPQMDAFSAAQERARRNYVSDAAERGGPLGNIQGEKRMMAERMGQSVGQFGADLIGREVQAKRAEIQAALAQMGGMLSEDQRAALEMELAKMDNLIKEKQIGLGGRELDIRENLGQQGINSDLMRTLLGNQQFYAGLGSENDRFLAQLGLTAADKARYYDLLERGILGS